MFGFLSTVLEFITNGLGDIKKEKVKSYINDSKHLFTH